MRRHLADAAFRAFVITGLVFAALVILSDQTVHIH